MIVAARLNRRTPAMHHFKTLLAALLLPTFLSAPLRADVATFAATKDATIFNDVVGNIASGQEKAVYAGLAGTLTSAPVRRGLFAFDVAGTIPAGSTIQSVQLKLYMSKTVSGSYPFALYKLTQSWNEGPTIGFSGGGGPAVAGDVTWVHTYWNTQTWSTPGASFVAASSASVSVNGVGYYTWGSTAALVADVQSWLDTPASSHGWILRGPESGPKNAKKFEARNSDSVTWRPVLTVNYTLPPPAIYCTSKTNSQGCVPAIGFTGLPDANAGSGFVISLANAINNQNGLLFYGIHGTQATPFAGGIMCVRAPLVRCGVQNAGGNPGPDDCSGAYALDFNARITSGADPLLVAGVQVCAEWWTRDPADPFTTNVSDALKFLIQP